jgi:hypothetical protein
MLLDYDTANAPLYPRDGLMVPATAVYRRIRDTPDAVLTNAEHALAAISEQYFKPNFSLEEMRALIRKGAKADPLKSFAKAPSRTQIDAESIVVVLR